MESINGRHGNMQIQEKATIKLSYFLFTLMILKKIWIMI